MNSQTPAALPSSSRTWAWVLLVIVAALALSPFLSDRQQPNEPANRVKCSSNLRQLLASIEQYYTTNRAWPMDLAAILEGDIGSECLVCPSSDGERAGYQSQSLAEQIESIRAHPSKHLSYGYIKPTTATPPPDDVLIFDLPGNHGSDGGHALLTDGRVVWMQPAELQALVQRQVP